MDKVTSFKTRLYLTGIVAVAIWALLIWNHYHGGVPSHYIGASQDMPAISNWWGALLLPLLTWFLLYRIQKRISDYKESEFEARKPFQNILYRFAGGLLFGILISICFTMGYSDLTGNLVLGLFALALFIPIYRAECLLGFVIGMTYTFGAVLPTGFGVFVILVGLLVYLFIRPGIAFILSRLGLTLSSGKHGTHQ